MGFVRLSEAVTHYTERLYENISRDPQVHITVLAILAFVTGLIVWLSGGWSHMKDVPSW